MVYSTKEQIFFTKKLTMRNVMFEKVAWSKTNSLMKLTNSGITNLRMTHVTNKKCSKTIIH